jgi:hypothetical protein
MRRGITAAVLALVTACAGDLAVVGRDLGDWTPTPVEVDGLAAVATVTDGAFALHTGGGPRGFLPGVNIGPTIPGTQPGAQAIRDTDFRRWFPQIHDLGLRVVRVYTIMPPGFYSELEAFNLAHPDTPLYLAHGVWIPEEGFYESRDLFSVEEEFHAEIERAVGVVHGDASLPDRPGHAHGAYTADVSAWLVSWLIGVEWDPAATEESDAVNRGAVPHRGRYFANTDDATPTEVWLARAMDHLAALERDRGVTMPIAFVNWPTTDPLAHPDEPLDKEDRVAVDANHVLPTEAWPGGSFASYHAYPYYPDFQRYEEGIAGFELDGEPDNYAGYLTKLVDHHAGTGLPTMVTEFGVPSAIGSAHHGPQGRDQGGHSEREAMAINADLLSVIHRVGMAGGWVFAWSDEWFKFTWNTIDLELPPDRRQLWANPWTNEANFGLLAIEPGIEPVVIIDGDPGEWDGNESQVVYESDGAVRQVRVVKDASYLYLAITTDVEEPWTEAPLVIGFDVIEGGSPSLPAVGDAGWQDGDYAVVVEGDSARSMVRASADPLLHQYGTGRGMIEHDPGAMTPDSISWNNHRLIVNRPLTIPSTGERRPAEVIDVGTMLRGTTNPDDRHFDSRATWEAGGTFVEVRVPYQAIGFSDPSSLTAYLVHQDGTVTTTAVDRVGIVVVAEGETHVTGGYGWEPWQAVEWRERPKAGIDALADAVHDTLG